MSLDDTGIDFQINTQKPGAFEKDMQKDPMSTLKPLAIEQLGAGVIPSPVLFVKPSWRRATRATTAIPLDGVTKGSKGPYKPRASSYDSANGDITNAIYTTECDYAYWYPSAVPSPSEADFGVTQRPDPKYRMNGQTGSSMCIFRFYQPGSRHSEGNIDTAGCDTGHNCGDVVGWGEKDSFATIQAGFRAINHTDTSLWNNHIYQNDRTNSFTYTQRGKPYASQSEMRCKYKDQYKLDAETRRVTGRSESTPGVGRSQWDLVLGMWVPPGTSVTFECCKFPPPQDDKQSSDAYYFIDGKGQRHTVSNDVAHRRKVDWDKYPDGVRPFTIRIDGGNQGIYVRSTNDQGKWDAAGGELGSHNYEITGVSAQEARKLRPEVGGTDAVGLLMSFSAGYWMTRDMWTLDAFDYQYGRDLNPYLHQVGNKQLGKIGGKYPVTLLKSFRFDVTPVKYNKYESGLAWLMINNCFRDLIITDDDIPDDRQVVTVLGTELPTFQPQTSMCDHLASRWCQYNLNRNACGCFKEQSQARRYVSSTQFSLPPQCFGKCADKSDSYQTREWSETGCNEEICESVLDQHGQSIVDSGQTEIVCDGRKHVIVNTPSPNTVPALNTATDDTSSNDAGGMDPTTIVMIVIGSMFIFLLIAWIILLIRRKS